jgi:hypothetical protein
MPSGDALTSHFPASRTQPPPTNPAARSTPTRIVPHDDHDDVLTSHGGRLDPEARRARNDAVRERCAMPWRTVARTFRSEGFVRSQGHPRIPRARSAPPERRDIEPVTSWLLTATEPVIPGTRSEGLRPGDGGSLLALHEFGPADGDGPALRQPPRSVLEGG